MNGKESNRLIGEINSALYKFGVRYAAVELRSVGISRYEVIVNGRVFGIWDSARKTFVD